MPKYAEICRYSIRGGLRYQWDGSCYWSRFFIAKGKGSGRGTDPGKEQQGTGRGAAAGGMDQAEERTAAAYLQTGSGKAEERTEKSKSKGRYFAEICRYSIRGGLWYYGEVPAIRVAFSRHEGEQKQEREQIRANGINE